MIYAVIMRKLMLISSKLVTKMMGGGEEFILGAKGFKRVKYSTFIIKTESVISKTEKSRTTSIIVLFKNMVANARKNTLKKVKSSCPWKRDLR